MVALKGGGGAFFRRAAWPLMLAVILAPAAVLVFFPAAVYDNYGRFVSWGAIVLAPLCAVQIVDYFILRRRRLNVRDLFRPIGESAYSYWKESTWRRSPRSPQARSPTRCCSTR